MCKFLLIADFETSQQNVGKMCFPVHSMCELMYVEFVGRVFRIAEPHKGKKPRRSPDGKMSGNES